MELVGGGSVIKRAYPVCFFFCTECKVNQRSWLSALTVFDHCPSTGLNEEESLLNNACPSILEFMVHTIMSIEAWGQGTVVKNPAAL